MFLIYKIKKIKKNDNSIKKSLNDAGYILSNNVYKKPENEDKYSSNFSKQWRDFSKTQVDEFNGTNISKNLLKGVIFNEFKTSKIKMF